MKTYEQLQAQLSSKDEVIGKMREALKFYADQKNWGNAGWEGHPDDYFKGPEIEPRKPWRIAESALSLSHGEVK